MTGRRLCAHADVPGRMHWIEPGQRCPDAPRPPIHQAATGVAQPGEEPSGR